MLSKLKIGAGRTDITPKLGARLMGYPEQDRNADSIHDPLHSTSLVFESNGIQAAIISLDLCIVDDEDVAAVRALVNQRTGIPAMHVMVGSIQTHSAPQTLSVWGWGDKDRAYGDFMIERAAESVAIAQKNLRAGRVGIATVQSDVGVNRRGVGEDGAIGLGFNPWGAYDPTMTVIRFEGDGGPIASLVHYGAHPTVFIGKDRAVSRDWPGVMVDRVEHFSGGAPCLFINGAVGDVAPRTNVLAAAGGGDVALQEVGGRAAMHAMSAYRAIRDFNDLPLAVLSRAFEMPYRPLASLDEAKRQVVHCEPTKDAYGMGMCDFRHWSSVVDAHARPRLTSKRYEQVITRLGPMAIVPFPGEPFAETVLRLRQFSPFQHTLAASTSCGSNGYFPTRESYARGGYEACVGRAYGPYLLAENIDDVLVAENLKLLRELHPE